MLDFKHDKENKLLEIHFPEFVVSSGIDTLCQEIEKYWNDSKSVEGIQTVRLILEKTSMIDSMGLNFIKTVIDWTKREGLQIEAEIYAEFVHMILQSVWLDREMRVIEKYN